MPLLLLLVGSALSACGNSQEYSTSHQQPGESQAQSCSGLLDTVLHRERVGDTASVINFELDTLGQSCPRQYRVFTDYVSIKIESEAVGRSSCAGYTKYSVESAAINLARIDGFCAGRRRTSVSGSLDLQRHGGRDAPWSCSFSPSYDNDWHNDVLCSNGHKARRPYLREWDSFVTEAEMMKSAHKYERQLNGQN